MGGPNYTTPNDFAGQRRRREEEIPHMRDGEGREWSGSAAATEANAAALPKRVKREPPA